MKRGKIKMAKYYAVGTQKVETKVLNDEGKLVDTHTVVNKVIDLSACKTRIEATNEANRIAKRQKISLDGVYIVKGTNDAASPMTKYAKERRAERTREHKENRRAKVAMK
jgi:lysophospholipase L1-like esterase